MRNNILSGMILGLLVFCFGGRLQASEVEELRERASALKRESEAAAARGNLDEAGRLGSEARRMIEAADRLDAKVGGRPLQPEQQDLDNEYRKLEERHQNLIEQERAMREANASYRELAYMRKLITESSDQLIMAISRANEERQSAEAREQTEKLRIAGRRIHHLRAAAEDLVQADEHDLARKLFEQAESMERDVQAAKERLAAGIQDRPKHVEEQQPGWVRKLREEIQQLRAEVRELRQKVEERGQADRRFTPPQPLEPSRSLGPAYEKK